MKKLLSLFVLVAIFVSSCKKEIKDYENVVEITPTDAQNYGLPPVHFKFSYPDNEKIVLTQAKSGQKNLSYCLIDYKGDSASIEEISFGYCRNCNLVEENKLSDILSRLSDEFSTQLTDYQEISNTTEDFDGEKHHVLKFKFKVNEEFKNIFDKGNYIGIIVPYIDKNSDNGVLIIMLANTDKSEIKDFSDFGKKGKLAGVFHTFRFVK